MRLIPNAFFGLLVAATLSAPAALAQGPAASPEQMHHKGQTSADRVEQHIAALHAKLHITQDEQALWDKFAEVMRNNAHQMAESAGERASKLNTMNASDNMQSYAQLAMTHAQDLQNLTAAFQPLYASFSPDQQHIADTMFRNVALRHSSGHQH